jgi:hypothetical protein
MQLLAAAPFSMHLHEVHIMKPLCLGLTSYIYPYRFVGSYADDDGDDDDDDDYYYYYAAVLWLRHYATSRKVAVRDPMR